MMLEAYELRDALRKARKELAESLYQHDAACRVIARLQAEKEAAEKALEDLQAQVVTIRQQAATAATAAATEGAPTEGPEPKRVCPPPHPSDGPTFPNAYRPCIFPVSNPGPSATNRRRRVRSPDRASTTGYHSWCS